MAIKTFLFLYVKMLFIHVMAKLNFQHHYFSLQCHVSCVPSEISWFDAQKHFL